MHFDLIHLFSAVTITPDLSDIDSIADFVKFVYDFAIGACALAVLIQFVRAGLKVFLAAGNASKIGEANTMMTNAVVGAIILFSAVLLLNTINSDLTANTVNPGMRENWRGGRFLDESR